jgi:hypothetical protein
MNLENVLNERSQLPKATDCVIPFARIGKLREKESRSTVVMVT